VFRPDGVEETRTLKEWNKQQARLRIVVLGASTKIVLRRFQDKPISKLPTPPLNKRHRRGGLQVDGGSVFGASDLEV